MSGLLRLPPRMELLREAKPAGGTLSVAFSGLPSGDDFDYRIDAAIPVPSVVLLPSLRFNGDSGANYSYRFWGGTGATFAHTYTPSDSKIGLSLLYSPYSQYWSAEIRRAAGGPVHTRIVYSEVSLGTAAHFYFGAGVWNSAAPLSEIALFDGFSSGGFPAGTAIRLSAGGR